MKRILLSLAAAALFGCALSAPAVPIPVNTGFTFVTVPWGLLGYNLSYIFSPPAPAQYSQAIFLDVSGYVNVVNYDPDLGGWDIDPLFSPGDGIIFFNPGGPTTFTPAFSSHASAGVATAPAPSPLFLEQNRYYLRGSPNPVPGAYEDITGAAPNDETALLRFIPGGSAIEPRSPPLYRLYHYKNGVWSPETPQLNALEAVFIIHPFLSVKYTVSGNPARLNLTCPTRAILEEADYPTGPWRNVNPAGSTHSVEFNPQASRSLFYRAKE